MIKAILCDTDGMLVTAPMWSYQLERQYNIPREQLSAFFKEKFPACLIGQADLRVEVEPYLSQWGWSGTVDELLAYWFKAEHEVDESLIDYLQRLRAQGYGCYLGTNQEQYRTAYMKNEMSFAQLFDTIYASCELGVRKPDPLFYQKILNDLDIPADQLLVWDNEQKNVDGALSVGCPAELYTTFPAFKKIMTEKYQIDLR